MKRYTVKDNQTGTESKYTCFQWRLAFFLCSFMGFISGFLTALLLIKK